MKQKFSDFHNISINQTIQILKERPDSHLFCTCGKAKKIFLSHNKYGSFLCLFRSCGDPKCDPKYGRKRPNHSKIMSELAASGSNPKFSATLMKKGEKFNKDVNSLDFKRKKLSNKGIDITNKSDDEIEALNSKYESDKQKTPQYLATRTRSFMLKHNLQDVFGSYTKDVIYSMSKEELLALRYKLDSWHHALYCADKCGAKHFKRIEKRDLKNHARGLTCVITRSSYESNYIDFFEENNIKWDYEPIRIPLDNTTYKPDFFFWVGDDVYILETKGFLLEKYRNYYLSVKINGGYDYSKQNGFSGMIFTYKSKPESLEQILEEIMKEKF